MLRSLASNIKKQGSGDGTRRYISKKLWEYITEFHLTEAAFLHAHRSKPTWSDAVTQRPPKAETLNTHTSGTIRESVEKEGKEIFGCYTVYRRCKLSQKQGMAAKPECGPAGLQGGSPRAPHPVVWCPPLGRRPFALQQQQRPHLLVHRPIPQLLLLELHLQLTLGHGCSLLDTILATCCS